MRIAPILKSNTVLNRAVNNRITTTSNVSNNYALQYPKVTYPYFAFGSNSEVQKVKTRVKPVMDMCYYGKPELFENIDDIRFSKINNNIYFENFYSKQTNDDDKITGICQELAYKTGKILQQELDDYCIFTLFTKKTKYDFTSHTCLALVEKNTQNEKVLATRKELTNIRRRMIALGDNMQSEEFKEAQALEKLLTENMLAQMRACAFWDGAIVVDPSLGDVFKMSDMETKNYEFDGFNVLDACNPYENPRLLIEENYSIPVGYKDNLVPELKGIFPDTVLSFALAGDQIYAVFFNEKVCMPFDQKQLNYVSPNSKLSKFIKKLNTEYKKHI